MYGGPGRSSLVVELQPLVDTLAARLNRPILVEDGNQRVITYSEHDEPGDEVRREAILRRRSPSAAIAWWKRFGISRAREPVRVPGNPGLGLEARVCVPILHGDTLLGHLWFVDADESMTDEEIGEALDAVPALALALYAEKLAGERAERREAEAVRELLLGDADARRRAADLLVSGGYVENGRDVTAIVARLRLAGDAPPDVDVTIALEAAVVAACRRVGTRAALPLVRSDHAVLLAATPPGSGRPTVEECITALDESVAAALGETRAEAVRQIGVGDSRPALTDAHDSYAEAVHAARIAARGEGAGIGRVARWSELGVYRLLAQLPADDFDCSVVHPGLARLLADPRARTLVETLEAYLEAAGSVRETAKRLHVHRQSLYYRLERIERLASTDLHDGDERLALHLALKLARLSGRMPGEERTAVPA